ncbi:MAG: hypothetical protein FJ306_03810 [Planctomycetes bacterium]|nr:hypothetical protein [Planctomycetota bacterium]
MRFLAASSLFFAAPLMAQVFPETEPNDTVANAQIVALGSQINGSVTAGDVDWYTFTTPGGYHSIQMLSDTTTGVDFVMDIFDASGTTLLAWCDDSGQLNYTRYPSYFGVVPAGTYTIRCKAFSSTSTGNYQFNLGQTASKPYTGNEIEPNDTLATAQPVGDGTQLNASLAAPIVVNTNAAAAATVVASDAVASSTATIITTAGAQVAGTYNGLYFVRFTSGANVGQSRRITSNTATTITTESWGTSIPAATDTFEIITNAATILSDTVASATTTVITSTAALTATVFSTPSNTHAVRFLTGANAGQSRAITANTATTITTAAWNTAPVAGDQYVVVSGGSSNSIALATPVTANQFGSAPGTGSIFWVRCTSGLNVGQSHRVQTNTANTILLASGFANAPAPGDTFEVDQYDSDLYRVDVTAPKAMVVFSVTDGTLPWVSGWSYEVLDAAGALVNSMTFGTNLADSSAFQGRVSSFRVFSTGTYYVRIFQRRSTPTTSTPIVVTGNYRFELKQRDFNTGGTVTETEPLGGPNANNTAATATPINPGQIGVGNITNSAGTDPSDLWGPITVPTASLIGFQVSAAATGTPLTDASLELVQLLDPVAGTLGTPSSVTGGNALEVGSLNPRGLFNFSLAGTQYYFRVLSPGTGAAQAGDYNLEITIPDLPTYLTANYATASANATGCGTAGVPTIGRVGSWEQPVIGQTFVQRVTNLNGLGNLGLLVLGTSGALGPSGAPAGSPQSVYNPQPLDLTLFGAPGCFLNVDPLDIQVLVGDATGTADFALPTPGNLALIGFVLFSQPCKWDFATPVNPLGIQPGNWSRIILGTRTF